MKLLYITNGINGSGGLERVLSVKASRLAEDYAYTVFILVLNEAHENPFYAFSPKISFISIPFKGNFIKRYKAYRRGIQKAVDQIRPDIISVCDDGLKGFFIPSLISSKAKMIYERHASMNFNTDNSLKGRVQRFLMKSQLHKFSKVIVLTNGNAREWETKNIKIIPNPAGFQSDEVASLENRRILAVGSHSYNKGYDLLIEIWGEIEKNYPNWKLDIFGQADPAKEFIKKAERKRLKNIHFHTPVKNIQKEYLESSLLVLPSRSEGFGMVLIEAMECGVPCVAFDCPSGPGDIIKDGEDGFLIKPNDLKAFEEKLQLLMENKELRKKMGKAARENVKRYSPEAIITQWDKLFKKLAAKDK